MFPKIQGIRKADLVRVAKEELEVETDGLLLADLKELLLNHQVFKDNCEFLKLYLEEAKREREREAARLFRELENERLFREWENERQLELARIQAGGDNTDRALIGSTSKAEESAAGRAAVQHGGLGLDPQVVHSPARIILAHGSPIGPLTNQQQSDVGRGGGLGPQVVQRPGAAGQAAGQSELAYQALVAQQIEYFQLFEEGRRPQNNNEDYHTILALDDVDLVSNTEALECPICFNEVNVGQGAVLRDCLHSFCRECLAGAVEFSDNAVVRCPFRNEEYSCESLLLEREVKSLVSPTLYERHLARSLTLAESQAQDSFHCRTPNCPGWCLVEDAVNFFDCPVCRANNCLTCAAIHAGRDCRQYQDELFLRCNESDEGRKTRRALEAMLEKGNAMRCPKCQVVLMKKSGCDSIRCSICHTDICWVTKGPRWGPGGTGDTSGGCKCGLNGKRCHPKCKNCH